MVRDMVEDDPERLICVLIDEVESLASSRSNTGNGDPSDAMRAVNSLLTSLDRLRPFPNVFVMATTNITGRIDDAFVDRVDLKMHIGMPIIRARYEILKSCLEELMRTGIVDLHEFAEFASLAEKETGEGSHANGNVDVSSKLLLDCAQRAEGLSGRSLRRLPLQAHAQFLPPTNDINEKKSVQSFLKALSLAVDSEQESRLKL
ncbi:unnamed protein product [Pseudo-nitzschia multistriata]|uniref:Uncharacterized protein n=1 Tax=Pseudo-nitzschia multistriata TaxID=183589 RepID=A0A448Z4P2_9STRA|nr:unnamed protein product [Pseudo-nitzschia multistriata]